MENVDAVMAGERHQTPALARLSGQKWLEKLAKWRSTCFEFIN
jgi:hypothetical protein